MEKQLNTTEARKERFIRLAKSRTNRILRLLNILANCSNNSNYVYDEDQVKKMFVAIRTKLDEVEVRFKPRKSTDFNF